MVLLATQVRISPGQVEIYIVVDPQNKSRPSHSAPLEGDSHMPDIAGMRKINQFGLFDILNLALRIKVGFNTIFWPNIDKGYNVMYSVLKYHKYSDKF